MSGSWVVPIVESAEGIGGRVLAPGDLGSSKVAVATVLDQASDDVIKPLSLFELGCFLDKWKVDQNDNEEPGELEEATGDQVSALAFS